MTKFNPKNKAELTYGECLDPAMKIQEEADARQYFDAYVAHIQAHLDREPRDDGMTAEAIARTNLGYYAGYYDNETRERVERMFACAHPIFGKAENGTPTPEQAFEAGRKMALTANTNSAPRWGVAQSIARRTLHGNQQIPAREQGVAATDSRCRQPRSGDMEHDGGLCTSQGAMPV